MNLLSHNNLTVAIADASCDNAKIAREILQMLLRVNNDVATEIAHQAPIRLADMFLLAYRGYIFRSTTHRVT